MTAIVAPARRGLALPGPVAAVGEFLRVLSRKPVGLVGLCGVAFFLALAYLAPLVVPLQDKVDVSAIYSAPSFAHPIGTDYQGRDVLNQIVYGGQDIITTAVLAAGDGGADPLAAHRAPPAATGRLSRPVSAAASTARTMLW